MKKYFKYFNYVLRHRWYVFLECVKLGIIWRGIIHDLSKFLPSEFIPYANYFYGNKRNCYTCGHIITKGGQCDINFSGIGNGEQAKNCKDYIKKGNRNKTGYYIPYDTGNRKFDFAWLLHQKRNRHHWQWWILVRDNDDNKGEYVIFDIPLVYRKEMLADWNGAGKAQGFGTNTKVWYDKNRGKLRLHLNTRLWIEKQLYG